MSKVKTVAPNSTGSRAIRSLESTVGNFANRLQRKLKEQEAQKDHSQQEDSKRRELILRTMTNIRKALQEPSKTYLGERFHFELEVGDWEGWPKVTLRLIDHLEPNANRFCLTVSVNDQRQQGTILIRLNSDQLLGRADLAREGQYERLALILRKSVRNYLDIVGKYVLDPKKPEEILEQATKPLHVENEPPSDAIEAKLKDENFFEEARESQDDNRVESSQEIDPILADRNF